MKDKDKKRSFPKEFLKLKSHIISLSNRVKRFISNLERITKNLLTTVNTNTPTHKSQDQFSQKLKIKKNQVETKRIQGET